MAGTSFPAVWLRRRLTGEGVLSGVNALHDPFSLFLVQCIIILSICRLLGLLGARFQQPKVVFEIIGAIMQNVADIYYSSIIMEKKLTIVTSLILFYSFYLGGIILGPSAIGRNENYLQTIFPPTSLPLLSVVANLGLVLYLFIVGMELDPKLLATHAKKAGAIAFMGMAVPFALGIAISKIMFDTLQAADPKYANVSFISFFVFIGTAMSITAFPVLARILKEGGLIYTTAGSMAMGAAALNDAAAWCLLVLAISLANSANLGTAGYVFLSVLAFAVVLIVLFRPLFWRLVTYVEAMHSPAMNNGLFCLTLIFVFLCAWTTALLGLDSIFGAFLFGLIMPRDSHLFKECNEKIEELVLSLTLPLYFALSGLKTDVTQINTATQGAMVVLVCFIATLGKYVGAGSAAYCSGMSVRESSVIAALMNTRGLVELIVLNLGVSAGILSTKTFSVMVVMCLVTTFMTCPVVNFIYPVHLRILASEAERMKLLIQKDEEFDEKEEGEGGEEENKSALVDNLDSISKMARLGVIVDRMEHLQGIMDLLSCFIPLTTNAKLTVTAIKAYEPSMTEKDVFIGLNSEGRLISVEAESTTLHLDSGVPHSQTIQLVPQELLPLSMFLRAIGGTVKAFRIRGDPREFPYEIRALTGKSSCNLILFPWRASQYVERLFWGSINAVSAPIALIVMLDTTLTPTIADIASGGGNIPDSKEARNRSQSTHARTRTFSGGSDPDGFTTAVHSGESRGRAASAVSPGIFSNNVAGVVSPGCPSSPSPVQGSLMRLLSGHDISVEENNTALQHPIIETSHQSASIESMLCIITNAAICSTMFPLALRFAERKSISITVLVTSDAGEYSDNLTDNLSAFLNIAESLDNIKIHFIQKSSKDVEAIVTHCAEEMYDLIVVGYNGGDEYVKSTEDVIPLSPPPPLSPPLVTNGSRSHRAHSVSFLTSVADSTETKRQSCGQESSKGSTLLYPELGLIGNHVKERGLASYLMVLHEPINYRQRRGTLWGNMTTMRSTDFPLIQKDLYTIDEEKV